MIMLLAGMILWWDLGAVPCQAGGVLAQPIHYDVRWNVRRVIAWIPGPLDGAGYPTSMPIYNDFAWTGDSTFAPPVDTMEPDLEPGSVLTYEVTAVDGQGQRDCGPV